MEGGRFLHITAQEGQVKTVVEQTVGKPPVVPVSELVEMPSIAPTPCNDSDSARP